MTRARIQLFIVESAEEKAAPVVETLTEGVHEPLVDVTHKNDAEVSHVSESKI